MSPITVDPAVYYAAARAIRTEYQGVIDAVRNHLNPGLATSAGMAGNYPAAAPWVSRYSTVAADLEGVLVAYGNAIQTLGDMLELAGYTWAKADHDANPATNKGGGPVSPPPRVGQAWDDKNIDIPDPMPAPYTTSDRGLRTNVDIFRDAFVTALRASNVQVPTGDSDALGAASTGWRDFAGHDAWLGGTARIRTVAATFESITAPEKPDILDMLGILADAPAVIHKVAEEFASVTAAHAAELADLRSRLVSDTAGAFPDYTVSASASNTAITITFTEEPERTAIDEASAALAIAIAGHPLYPMLATTVFTCAEELPASKARLEEIVSSPVDELVNRATWRSSAPRCQLNPEGQRDYSGANDIVRGWIDDAVRYGNEAGVDPKLVLAIVYNEGGERADSQLEQIGSGYWDAMREILNPIREATSPADMGMSLGLTNIKEKTYLELQEKYPEQFGDIPWARVQYDDSFAIMSATYTLKRIQEQYGTDAPEGLKENYNINEFMAAGYNSELSMADYFQRGDLGPQVKQYLVMTDSSYAKASELIDGAYTCG